MTNPYMFTTNNNIEIALRSGWTQRIFIPSPPGNAGGYGLIQDQLVSTSGTVVTPQVISEDAIHYRMGLGSRGMAAVGNDLAATYGQWAFTDSDYMRNAPGRRIFRRAKASEPGGKPACQPITPTLRDWRSQMPAADVERLEAAAGGLLDELDYPRAFPRPRTEKLESASRIRSLLVQDPGWYHFAREPRVEKPHVCASEGKESCSNGIA